MNLELRLEGPAATEQTTLVLQDWESGENGLGEFGSNVRVVLPERETWDLSQ